MGSEQAAGATPQRQRALAPAELLKQKTSNIDELHARLTELQAAAAEPARDQQALERKAVGLDEVLTQTMLQLDLIDVEGDSELRAARKAQIKRIQQMHALLDKCRGKS
eukprot:g63572.t1